MTPFFLFCKGKGKGKGTGTGTSAWGQVEIDELSATGTASSSTFLRGDGSWAAPSGGGGGDLLAANNLSDVANAATALSNLGGAPALGADDNYVTDAEKVVIGNTSGTNTGDQDLSSLATKANVLELDNTTVFTPAADYEPATKKYVDDNAGGGGLSNIVEDITPQLGGDLDPNGNAITGYLPSIDEDDMTSNSASFVPTQQSVKAYVDTEVAGAGGGGGGANPYNADIVVAPSGGDYTTLGAALAVAAVGDVIFVENGTYTESSARTVANRVIIYGQDAESTIIDLQNQKFEFNGAGTEIRNLRWNVGGNANDQLNLDCDDFVLEGNRFYQAASTGIGVKCENTRGKILKNTFKATAETYAELLQVTASKTVISDNVFYSSGGGASGKGIVDISGANCTFSSNNVHLNANTSGSYALKADGPNATFVGNTITGGDIGIYIGSLWITVSGNTITDCNTAIQVNSTDAVVTGNNAYIDGSTPVGVNVNGAGANVSGNLLQQDGAATGTGITVQATMDNTCITGNTLKNFSTGINVSASTCDDTLISGNHLKTSTTPLSDSGTNTLDSGNLKT